MVRKRLSQDERRENRRAACAAYNAKNAESLREKARERMRRLRAARKPEKVSVGHWECRINSKSPGPACCQHRMVSKPRSHEITKYKHAREDASEDSAYYAGSEASDSEGVCEGTETAQSPAPIRHSTRNTRKVIVASHGRRKGRCSLGKAPYH